MQTLLKLVSKVLCKLRGHIPFRYDGNEYIGIYWCKRCEERTKGDETCERVVVDKTKFFTFDRGIIKTIQNSA